MLDYFTKRFDMLAFFYVNFTVVLLQNHSTF